MIDNIDFMDSKIAGIKVVGIGGGGGNVVNMMIESNMEDVEFMVFNTDSQALVNNKAKVKIQIGDKLTRGLGAGANPEMGYRSMEQDISHFENMLDDTDMIFVISCLGGGTGSGATIPFLELCRKKGVLTVSIVTKPFTFEGRKRKIVADQALEFISDRADTTIVLSNDNLISSVSKNLSLKESFKCIDSYLSENIQSIINLINKPGIINLDFADVTTILKNSRLAVFGSGKASGKERAKDVVEMAINSPLLDRDISNAERVLLNITGPGDLSLYEVNYIAEKVAEKVKDDANIIFGANTHNDDDDEINMTLLVSGFND